MRLLCISDLHGRFEQWAPETLPEADAALVAGDFTNWGMAQFSYMGEARDAHAWMEGMAKRYGLVYYILGNHDLCMAEECFEWVPGCLSVDGESCIVSLSAPPGARRWKSMALRGVNLSPCWDAPSLARTWRNMTADESEDAAAFAFGSMDIVLSHCPPFGILDGADGHRFGSKGLRAYINRECPALVVCGHIHECGGRSQRLLRASQSPLRSTLVVNCAEHPMVVDICERGAGADAALVGEEPK